MISQILIEGCINGSIIALVAIGVSFIWGVMNITNFAQGDFLMIGMYIGYFMNVIFGWDPIFSLPIAAGALFIIGWIIYKCFIKKVLTCPSLSQRLLTFAISLVLGNLALMCFGGKYLTVPNLLLTGVVKLGSISIAVVKIVPFVTCIILATALHLFVTKTKAGKAIQATSMDHDAASLMGIDSDKSFALAFAISAALSGAAGCILTYYYYIYPNVGTNFQLFAFMAVAMGGFGSIPGALLGGILMGIIDTGTGVFASTAFKYLAVCVAYVVVVSVRPKGLFGR